MKFKIGDKVLVNNKNTGFILLDKDDIGIIRKDKLNLNKGDIVYGVYVKDKKRIMIIKKESLRKLN